MDIRFSVRILAAAPHLRVIAIEAQVSNAPTSDALWQQICDRCAALHSRLDIAQVNKLPGIAPTRAAYKACGKDPNRYRPSAEALTRRAVKGMELYRTLTIIDLINLVSLHTGHSIGGFDHDKIEGDSLLLDVGAEGEPFEAIGRGQLNIAGLPAYRDRIGAIGTPTSDCERTKLSASSSRLLMLVNVYDPESDIEALREYIERLLTENGGSVATCKIYKPNNS